MARQRRTSSAEPRKRGRSRYPTLPKLKPEQLGQEHVATAIKSRTCFGKNLFLQVSKSDDGSGGYRYRRSWVYRYRRNGKETVMGLGGAADVPLDKAREMAALLRQQQRGPDKIDPLAARRAEQAAKAAAEALRIASTMTFEKAAREFHAQYASGWRNDKHREQVITSLQDYAFPELGALAVADITRPMVLRVLKPIWEDIPETASRVRGRIEAVLDWASAHGYRPEGASNPAAWKGGLAHALPARTKVAKVVHQPAIPYTDLPALMTELAPREGVAALALRYTILTAARTKETIGATWDEIDLDNAVWTIPADRMKAENLHRVPVPKEALSILRAVPREDGNPFVFISPDKKGAHISNMAMLNLLQKRMRRPDITVHGMRSTFRDWCREQTNFPRELAEAALAHVLKDKTEAAYARGDMLEKRAKLMAAWARYCTTPRAAATVTAIRAAS